MSDLTNDALSQPAWPFPKKSIPPVREERLPQPFAPYFDTYEAPFGTFAGTTNQLLIQAKLLLPVYFFCYRKKNSLYIIK